MMQSQQAIDAAALSTAIEAFVAYTESLPPDALRPVTTAEWGPREALSHLVFWHEEYARILEGRLRGAPYEPLTGSFKDLNAQAVEMNRAEPIATLIDRWRTAQRRLTDLLAGDVPPDLSIVFRHGSMSRPLAVAIGLVTRHTQSHLRQLKRRSNRPLVP